MTSSRQSEGEGNGPLLCPEDLVAVSNTDWTSFENSDVYITTPYFLIYSITPLKSDYLLFTGHSSSSETLGQWIDNVTFQMEQNL